MLFNIIFLIILLPILLLIIILLLTLSLFKGKKKAVNYMTDDNWQELVMLEEHRRRMVARVESLQTILTTDFPSLSIPKIAVHEIKMNRSDNLASTVIDKVAEELNYLEQHIFRLETVLDTQLPNWRNV
ncbi:hypothetical protein [Thorsellia kenyensis]|uniref:Uncharacterized protein n=1 Tax=Thorsellia kenyensis TaxID=1549888 RepID=A0ABV6C775_9GAMM